MRHILTIILATGLFAAPALAEPQITETLRHYEVSATTARGLANEMRRKGPKGFWAYTRWEIRWSGGCNVKVQVNYTMPRHRNPDAMDPRMRQSFQTMLERLMAHERQHGRNGISAAREISESRCKRPHQIIRKYNEIDLAFDRRTNHGVREGVRLD
ncbi:DUF922 domain-containing protein [Marimonas sp. MJW-29]|uniref:DUF922 domain-containing protein n=1 Tax=Sulfitobacter sediminis TaxID=3234186 RepID=A0ABV3RNF4_9RHOB